jgi:o-succinylbenzoate synthase
MQKITLPSTLKIEWVKHTLTFKQPSGTSRGVLYDKPTWYLVIRERTDASTVAVGECSPIPGLSVDDISAIEPMLSDVCETLNTGATITLNQLADFPCICFGLETAFADLSYSQPGVLYDTAFTRGEQGIVINGLIWMGDIDFMRRQIQAKLEEKCTCIKIKIGAVNFENELALLKELRRDFNADTLEIRVDANGAFEPKDALAKLGKLSELQLHSIEQPIAQGQWLAMAQLCRNTPLPIALDEELISIHDDALANTLLSEISPQYIIIKPSLLGGILMSEKWIKRAERFGIKWWITSALESNVGLNAIAQWTSTLNVTMPQGLGTGKIYTNNITSPLAMAGDKLFYRSDTPWEYPAMLTQERVD